MNYMDFNPLFCRLLCIKQLENLELQECTLQNAGVQELIGGKTEFTSVKFTETTFLTRSLHFYLVLLIFEGNRSLQIKELQEEKLVYMTISPPIYVISKKKPLIQNVENYQHYEKFPLTALDKAYKSNSKEKGTDIISGNGLSDLVSYLCNRYIRNKIFHPVFIFLRFNEAIKLYYNVNQVDCSNKGEILLSILKRISEIRNADSRSRDRCARYGNVAPNKAKDKLLILCLNVEGNQSENKELVNQVTSVSNFLQNLEGTILSYQRKRLTEIPDNFCELEYQPDLKSQYLDYYNWENQKPHAKSESQGKDYDLNGPGISANYHSDKSEHSLPETNGDSKTNIAQDRESQPINHYKNSTSLNDAENTKPLKLANKQRKQAQESQ